MTALEFNYKLTNLNGHLSLFARKLATNEEDARDLLQETYLKALTYKDKFVQQNNFTAWVFTIMKNIFINDYRRKKRQNTLLDSTEEHYYLNNSAEETYAKPDSVYAVSELEKAIQQIDPDFRRAFEMHNKGFKYKEIAEELNLSIGTVKNRIFIVRQKLMDKLKDYKPN